MSRPDSPLQPLPLKAKASPALRSDGELMAAVQAGSVDAFAEIFERYRSRARRVANAVCNDDGRAEDAVQEAFVAIWKTRGGFDCRRGSVAAWLLAVVRHRAIDAGRRSDVHARRWADESPLLALAGDEDVFDEVARRADARAFGAQLALLPEPQQVVVILAFYCGLSHMEIARLLELPPGTVKGRMRLGLERLRTKLEHAA